MKAKRESQRTMEHRRKLKELGWKQLSILVPDKNIAEKLLAYKWLLMRETRKY
jgi:hypothetical protein